MTVGATLTHRAPRADTLAVVNADSAEKAAQLQAHTTSAPAANVVSAAPAPVPSRPESDVKSPAVVDEAPPSPRIPLPASTRQACETALRPPPAPDANERAPVTTEAAERASGIAFPSASASKTVELRSLAVLSARKRCARRQSMRLLNDALSRPPTNPFARGMTATTTKKKQSLDDESPSPAGASKLRCVRIDRERTH